MKAIRICCRGRAALRPTAISDLDFILASERHPDNAPFIRQWSAGQHEAAMSDPNIGHFVVESVPGQRPVGHIILVGLENPDFCLELRRIVIARKGCGYGREALRLVKAYTFDTLTFHRLWLDVFTNNKRALKLYKSEGFTVEGVHREAVRYNDGFVDVKVMSILRSEYYERIEWRPTRIIGDALDMSQQSGGLYIR